MSPEDIAKFVLDNSSRGFQEGFARAQMQEQQRQKNAFSQGLSGLANNPNATERDYLKLAAQHNELPQFNRSFEALGGLAAARDREERAKIEAYQFQDKYAQLTNGGEKPITIADAQALMAEFPTQTQNVQAAYAQMSVDQQKAMKSTGDATYYALQNGNIPLAKSIASRYSDALKNGKEPEQAEIVDDLIRQMDEDPQGVLTQLSFMLAASGSGVGGALESQQKSQLERVKLSNEQMKVAQDAQEFAQKRYEFDQKQRNERDKIFNQQEQTAIMRQRQTAEEQRAGRLDAKTVSQEISTHTQTASELSARQAKLGGTLVKLDAITASGKLAGGVSGWVKKVFGQQGMSDEVRTALQEEAANVIKVLNQNMGALSNGDRMALQKAVPDPDAPPSVWRNYLTAIKNGLKVQENLARAHVLFIDKNKTYETAQKPFEVKINGKLRTIPAGTSLEDFLRIYSIRSQEPAKNNTK
jgi:hypothetical protein